MLRLAILAVVLVAVNCASLLGGPEDYMQYRIQHNKFYSPEEQTMREAIFKNNVAYIKKHNSEHDKGLHTYTLGLNKYADWTTTEFAHFMNGYRMTNRTSCNRTPTHIKSGAALPDMVDWRKEGYVTAIKDQKQCGSCWAFSTTGSLEGQHFKKTGMLVSLSEQNLVDCSGPEGNMGCSGGLMDQAFEYIKINMGVDTEMSYPYMAKNGECKFNRANVGATDTGYVDVKRMDEMALKDAVATVGPISVAIDASKQSFQLYKDGVYSDTECSSTQLDHGVLAIGYGTDMDSGMDYWLVKNSWGMSWGMMGYIKMARNMNNMCGIATQASYPTV